MHRNTINFLGLRNYTDYYTFKRIDDTLIGLDINQTLTTWNLTTGKIKKTFLIKEDLELEGYYVFEHGNSHRGYMSLDWF